MQRRFLRVLTPVRTSKTETASRVRRRMETVLDWAVAQGWRQDNPPSKLIAKALPNRPRTKNHHQALPYSDIPDIPAALDQFKRSTN